MIRPLSIKDHQQLIALLQLNTPQYFDPTEEKDYIDYLNNEADNYFVVEQNQAIVGAGGFNKGFDQSNTARISWDIIHPDYQGQGIGKQLTLFRINEIKKDPSVNKIEVRTSQLVYKFYEKLGFELVKIVKDFWAKDFDLYQMTLNV